MDAELFNELFKAERKTIEVSVRSNHGGSYLRIREETAGRFTAIIIPYTGVAALVATLKRASHACGAETKT